MELPRFMIPQYSQRPCEIGRAERIGFLNVGGQSKGLTVIFSGDYVEQEEIIFENVEFQRITKNGDWTLMPISLQKIQLSNGQLVYYHHAPDVDIPPKITWDRYDKKRVLLEMEHEIGIRFVPQGNERKRLDITVTFIPDGNLQGQATWNVWMLHGSKKKYLEELNKSWCKRDPSAMISEDSIDGI